TIERAPTFTGSASLDAVAAFAVAGVAAGLAAVAAGAAGLAAGAAFGVAVAVPDWANAAATTNSENAASTMAAKTLRVFIQPSIPWLYFGGKCRALVRDPTKGTTPLQPPPLDRRVPAGDNLLCRLALRRVLGVLRTARPRVVGVPFPDEYPVHGRMIRKRLKQRLIAPGLGFHGEGPRQVPLPGAAGGSVQAVVPDLGQHHRLGPDLRHPVQVGQRLVPPLDQLLGGGRAPLAERVVGLHADPVERVPELGLVEILRPVGAIDQRAAVVAANLGDDGAPFAVALRGAAQ